MNVHEDSKDILLLKFFKSSGILRHVYWLEFLVFRAHHFEQSLHFFWTIGI